jgi:hypothetical protein
MIIFQKVGFISYIYDFMKPIVYKLNIDTLIVDTIILTIKFILIYKYYIVIHILLHKIFIFFIPNVAIL